MKIDAVELRLRRDEAQHLFDGWGSFHWQVESIQCPHVQACRTGQVAVGVAEANHGIGHHLVEDIERFASLV